MVRKYSFSDIEKIVNNPVKCERCGNIMDAFIGDSNCESIEFRCCSCGYSYSTGYGQKKKFYNKYGYSGFVDSMSKYSVDVLDAFGVLGLKPGASKKEISVAYRKLAKKWHPDANRENIEIAEEKLKKINKSKEILDRLY